MKKKKRLLLLLLLLLLLFALLYGANRYRTQRTDDVQDADSPMGGAQMDAKNPDGSDIFPDGTRVIEMLVRNWEFSRNEIRAKKGELVVVRLSGMDGTHGFAVPYLGINVAVSEVQPVTVTIPTDKVGEFLFFCSSPCGDGHPDMKGMVIVEE